ncbi:hypothetical protein [Chitinimonas sp. BJB300]|uniref:hypothetical protein n=1 Tax=Chitinimonas sp. BJB300 TaxID=1559339 RepID=UPI000C105A44|nr:hypothetical protein [Chitinimonas sp. BJB300]PHV11479.1 hypothetical protein CSQ89_10630 [Chitinimonas sp. BJB300]TSJ88524.1 hypothetical protein FG002_010155 [Chitinimonas sp. BJB300]
MKPITLQDRDPRHSGTSSQQVDARASARFRQLLDTTPDNLNAWTPSAPVHADLPADPGDDAAIRNGVMRRDPISHAAPALAPKLPDSQSMALRTLTGPLAGLVVQARMSGDRLTLKLITPSAELAERMTANQDTLASALGVTFGFSVTLEVEYDATC